MVGDFQNGKFNLYNIVHCTYKRENEYENVMYYGYALTWKRKFDGIWLTNGFHP